LYKGKKFNSRKETVVGEEYLGVKIFRFYVKCTRCSSELTIKTDPKNSDYVCEMGASRNFEPWRENNKIVEEAKQKRKKEEEGDAMKALENRTVDSKQEMDILDALDELRSLKARHSKLDTNELLKHCKESHELGMDSDDEEIIKNTVFRKSADYVRKIDEEEEQDNPLLNLTVNSNVSKLINPKKRKLFQFVVQAKPITQPDTQINEKSVVEPKVIEDDPLSLLDYADD